LVSPCPDGGGDAQVVEAFEYHVLGELWGIPRSLLENCEEIRSLLEEAVSEAGLTLFQTYVVRRKSGLIAVAVVGESHVAISTWPELGVAIVEVSSCKDSESTWEVYSKIREGLGAPEHHVIDIRSGIPLLEKLESIQMCGEA